MSPLTPLIFHRHHSFFRFTLCTIHVFVRSFAANTARAFSIYIYQIFSQSPCHWLDELGGWFIFVAQSRSSSISYGRLESTQSCVIIWNSNEWRRTRIIRTAKSILPNRIRTQLYDCWAQFRACWWWHGDGRRQLHDDDEKHSPLNIYTYK